MRERWDNRLLFRLSELAERYLRGSLAIHLHGLANCRRGLTRAFCLLVQQRGLKDELAREINVQGEKNKYEFSVLINPIQVVNYPDGIIQGIIGGESIVRLQTLNQC